MTYLQKVYNAEWGESKKWGAPFFREVFGGGSKDILPETDTTQWATDVSNDTTVTVSLMLLASNPKGVKTHRVLVMCRDCKSWVYAGRANQHKCRNE